MIDSKMKLYTTIEIVLMNGDKHVWHEDEWDDYEYDGKMFIIKNAGAWVGMYNINVINNIMIE